MRKLFLGLILISILINCEIPQQKSKLFPLMKNITHMSNIKNGKIKPFIFKITDTILKDSSLKNRLFYISYMTYVDCFALAVEEDKILSLTPLTKDSYVDEGSVINFIGNISVAGNPFGGLSINLKEKKYDKKNKDTVYIYLTREINTYDIGYPINDSIEIKKIIISKKRGFLEFTIRDKKTNDLYIANSTITPAPASL